MATNWLIPSPDPASHPSSPLSRSFSGALTREVSLRDGLPTGISSGLGIRIIDIGTECEMEMEKRRRMRRERVTRRGRGRGSAGRSEKVTTWDDGHVSAMWWPAKAGAAVDTPLPRSLRTTRHRLSSLRRRRSGEDRQRDPIEVIDDFLNELYLDNAKLVHKLVNQAHAQASGQLQSRQRRLHVTLRANTNSPQTPSASSSSASSSSLSLSLGQAAVATPRSSSISGVGTETPTKPRVAPALQKPNCAAHRRLRIQTSNLILHPLSPALSPTSLSTPDTASSGHQTVFESCSSDSPSRPRQATGTGTYISGRETVLRGYRTYGLRVVSVPEGAALEAIDQQCKSSPTNPRGALCFFDSERQVIADKVNAKEYHCSHENCIICHEFDFVNLENRAMTSSMPAEERQKIINANRSLRNIKNELENLSENGMISDDVYDKIMSQLPNEMSLNASSRAAAAPSAPVNDMANLNIRNEPPPPSYNSSTPQAPSLPTRQQSDTPSKPEIGRATAIYRYAEPDDCTFEVGDQIAIYEHMNNDWWFGKNLRTGKEGVFPVTYVQSQANSQPPPSQYGAQGAYGNEKAQNQYNGGGYPGQYQQQGPPPPGPSNPYNAAVPPMAVAESGNGQPSKGQEAGKKFGKKLGNAAIFGAGATIGGKIVNSIF